MVSGQTIAKAKFNVVITGFENHDLQIVVLHSFELYSKGDNDYGNRTGVECVLDNGTPEYYDTRYDLSLEGDGSNFSDWCREEIAARWKERLVSVEEIV